MSNLKVFSISNEIIELEPSTYELEIKLQRIIEDNMMTFFGIDFLDSEYAFNGGRIDSLGIDENNCPVIFEYKRSMNENVINQGLYYLEWLLDHKADFELLVLKKFGGERAAAIEWKTPIVYCVANTFTKFDVNAVKQMQRNIFLIEYNRFNDDILVFDYLNLDNNIIKLQSETSIKSSGSSQIYSTIEDRILTLNDDLKPILKEIQEYILSFGDDITEVVLKQYVAYKKIKNFITIDVTKEKIQLYLHLDPLKEDLVVGFSRNVTNIGHLGTGNLEITIREEKDFYKAKELIQKVYFKN